MSHNWTKNFVLQALKRTPACPHPCIPGFGMCAYDNLRIAVGHKAFATMDTRGESTNYSMDLSTWLTFGINTSVAPQLGPGRLRHISECTAPKPA